MTNKSKKSLKERFKAWLRNNDGSYRSAGLTEAIEQKQEKEWERKLKGHNW
jgi:hypothetical protein